MNEESNGRLSEILSRIGKKKWFQYSIVGILSLLVILIFIMNFSSNTATKSDATSGNYVADLENRLSAALSKVNGAGEVSVVITVESGMETVIAIKKEEVKTDNSYL